MFLALVFAAWVLALRAAFFAVSDFFVVFLAGAAGLGAGAGAGLFIVLTVDVATLFAMALTLLVSDDSFVEGALVFFTFLAFFGAFLIFLAVFLTVPI